MLYSISSRFKVSLWWLVNAYSSHSIHRGRGASVPGMQRDGFATEPGGILDVAM